MYIFERAYVDYSARLILLCRWFGRACAKTWIWFWSGFGARAIETLLRICVAVSGIVFGTWYVIYRRGHGEGVNWETAVAFIVIAGIAITLSYGLKFPVHLLARLATGVFAGTLVGGLGAAVVMVGSVVFAGYLVSLVLLTGLSAAVFLPVLACEWIGRRVHGITYECGHANCASRKGRFNPLPVHRCECGQEYSDLYPSFYGVFHHVCRDPAHKNGKYRLPTLDRLGRNRLRRRCRVCGQDLIHTDIGLAAPYPILVIGDTNSGKTVFLSQAIRILCRKISGIHGGASATTTKEQRRSIDHTWDLLDRGQVLPATSGEIVDAVGLALSIPKRLRRTLLLLYDAPGEDFQTMTRFARKQALETAKGIVFLVDPLTLPGIEMFGRSISGEAGEMSAGSVAGNLVHLMQSLKSENDGKFDTPMAVIISKGDELPSADLPFLANLYSTNGDHQNADTLSTRCKEAIVKLGGGNVVRTLETHFAKIRFFACSALGRRPAPENRAAFQPAGVIEPLLWMLGLNLDGLAMAQRSSASADGE
jgi:hypothetical protein